MKTALVFLLAVIVVSIVIVQFFSIKRDRDAAANYPHMGRLIDVDGVTVHAVQTGQGPDVVLLHGASGNTRDFSFAFADMLKDRYRVTMLDRPGMGWTEQLDPAHRRAFSTAHASPRDQARFRAGRRRHHRQRSASPHLPCGWSAPWPRPR